MKINKRLIILIVIIVLTIIFINNKCYAVLQANGAAVTQQSLNDWAANIRKMEMLGGGMGLTETIKSDLTPNTPSNNLDIHMQKNTEYGAMAILSASSYGNPNKIVNGGTTTGNKTGIVINFNKEWVAAISNSVGSPIDQPVLFSANAKYKNMYINEENNRPNITNAKKGDATLETAGWHNSGGNWWIDNSRAGFVRGYNDSIFSYYGRAGGVYSMEAANKQTYASRAAMVCGEGI